MNVHLLFYRSFSVQCAMDEISTTYRHDLNVKGSIGYRSHVFGFFFFARLGLRVQFYMASCSCVGLL